MSIRTVFEQKGFDGASMQDLARAAGMSAGNFYRYFSSKNDIIAAMVELDLRDVAEIFRRSRSSDDPRAAFLGAIRTQLIQHSASCDGPLWAEIDAAAGRRPEIARITDRMERDVLHYLLETFALITGRPIAEMATRFTGHARLMVVIFKGTAMQPNLTAEFVNLAVSTVDLLLDQIATASREPVPASQNA